MKDQTHDNSNSRKITEKVSVESHDRQRPSLKKGFPPWILYIPSIFLYIKFTHSKVRILFKVDGYC